MKRICILLLIFVAVSLISVSCKKIFPTIDTLEEKNSLNPGGEDDYTEPEELTDVFLKEVKDKVYGYTDDRTGKVHYFTFSFDGKIIEHKIFNPSTSEEEISEKYYYEENLGASQANYSRSNEDGSFSENVYKVILMEDYYVLYMNDISVQGLKGYLGYDPNDPSFDNTETDTFTFRQQMRGKTFKFRGLLTVHTYKFSDDGIAIQYSSKIDGEDNEVIKAVYNLNTVVNDNEALFNSGNASVRFLANDQYTELYITEIADVNFKGYLASAPGNYNPPSAPNFMGKTYRKNGSAVTLYFQENGKGIKWWNGSSLMKEYFFNSDNIATKTGNSFKGKFGGFDFEVSEDISTIKFSGSEYTLYNVEAPGVNGEASGLKNIIKNKNYGEMYEVSLYGETIFEKNVSPESHYFYIFVRETGTSALGYEQAIYQRPNGDYYGVQYDREYKAIRISTPYTNIEDVEYNGTWVSNTPLPPNFKPIVKNKTFVSDDGIRYVFNENGDEVVFGNETFKFEKDLQSSGDYLQALYSGLTIEYDKNNNSLKINSKDVKWYSYAYESPNKPVSSFKGLAKSIRYRKNSNKYVFSSDGSSVTVNNNLVYTYLEDRPDGANTKRAVYKNGSDFYMAEIITDTSKVQISGKAAYTSLNYNGGYYNKVIDFETFAKSVKNRVYRKSGTAITLYFNETGKSIKAWNGISITSDLNFNSDIDDIVLDGDYYYSYGCDLKVKTDSSSMNIISHGLAWFTGDYNVYTTSESLFKDSIKNTSFESRYITSPFGDVIYWKDGAIEYYYTFIEDRPNSPEGYQRAVYQKPNGEYYGVELIVADTYKAIRMGGSSSISSIKWEGTWYISGTTPNVTDVVPSKTYVNGSSKYVFNADGKSVTWGGGTYNFLKNISYANGELRAIYTQKDWKGTYYYGVSVNLNGSKMKMTDGAWGEGTIIWTTGSWYNLQ